MKICYLLSAIIVSLICKPLIKIEKRNFVDDKGRINILHGVNVVYKLPPYFPTTENFDPFFSLCEEDVKLMKQFGFNLVRLGITWESIETSPGVYNYEHLEKIESIVNLLGQSEIHVLIDAHQDLFSRLFCGEGVPSFYAKELYYETECDTNILSRLMRTLGACLPLKEFNWRYDEEGLPLLDDCKVGFMKFHQSPELTTIYNSFYNNQNQIQDKFAGFWKILANKFKDNKYVIGFDLWNEPWPGNLWSDPRSMWPGYSSRNQVIPFYRKLDQEIRKVHPESVSFFQPCPFPDTIPFLGGKSLGKLTDTPAGTDFLDKQVLNMHSYCCQASPEVCESGEPNLNNSKTLCANFHKSKMISNLEMARKLGVAFIVTEFGACSDSESCYFEMKGFVEAAEENFVSWAYWMYKPYGDHTTTAAHQTEGIFMENGVPQEFKIKALSRTYIQAYQGIPISSHFDSETATYTGEFIFDPNIDAPTILYLNNEYYYSDGYLIFITDKNGKNINYVQEFSMDNYFSFKIKNSLSIENNIINVQVKRKNINL